MKMPKPSDHDRERFHALVPDDPRVDARPMFGNVAAFVNGNMFMGLFGSQIGIRVDDATRGEVLALDGAGPFGPEDRPMREYVALPPDVADDPARAAPLVEKSVAHVAALPPKNTK